MWVFLRSKFENCLEVYFLGIFSYVKKEFVGDVIF